MTIIRHSNGHDYFKEEFFMLLNKSLENDQSLKMAKFMVRLKRKGLLKAFICFTDDKGKLKSMTYEYGEYYQLDLETRKVETITAADFFRNLLIIQKGLYTSRAHGQLRLVNSKIKKRGYRPSFHTD